MIMNSNFEMEFDDRPEMFYSMFNEIGIDIDHNGYLYDEDSRSPIKFKDKNIKTTKFADEVVYCDNRIDILFEPLENYHLMICLFGYFINKQFPLDCYVAQFIEDNPDKTKQRVVVRTSNGDIFSPFYKNIYLGYCYLIFAMTDQKVNLDKFDIDLGEEIC